MAASMNLKRHKVNGVTLDGKKLHILGDPFQVTKNPPGEWWVAAVCGDGKVRPFPAPEVMKV